MALLMDQSRSAIRLLSAKAQEFGELWREKCTRDPSTFPFELARTSSFRIFNRLRAHHIIAMSKYCITTNKAVLHPLYARTEETFRETFAMAGKQSTSAPTTQQKIAGKRSTQVPRIRQNMAGKRSTHVPRTRQKGMENEARMYHARDKTWRENEAHVYHTHDKMGRKTKHALTTHATKITGTEVCRTHTSFDACAATEGSA